jgi:hypothetical protein
VAGDDGGAPGSGISSGNLQFKGGFNTVLTIFNRGFKRVLETHEAGPHPARAAGAAAP